jgi:hypothetical protein
MSKILTMYQEYRPRAFEALKGQCHEIFCFRFFHESCSTKPPKILLGSFGIFSKIRRDIRKYSKYAPPVSTTLAANFATGTIGVVDIGGKFATGVKDTGGKFATRVSDTCGKLPLISTTAAVNLPPVSTTAVANTVNIRLVTP